MPHLFRIHHPNVQQLPGQPLRPVSSQQVMCLVGPTLQVSVSVSKALADELVSKDKPVPGPVTGVAMIDTGAANSCIDLNVAAQLGLPVIDQVKVNTPDSFGVPCDRYSVTVEVADSTWKFDTIAISKLLCPQNLCLLIGRDVLANVHFTYNGEFGYFTVSF